MASRQLRVFLDANILIRGITFPRLPYEVLRHAARGDFVPILSPMVLDSARLYVGRLFPGYSQALETLLTLLDCHLAPDPSRDEVMSNADLVRDVKDVPVALSAIQAGADYLVSTDRDFTVQDSSTDRLRKHLRPISPGSFLRTVMNRSSEDLLTVEHRQWLDLGEPFWAKTSGHPPLPNDES